MNQNRAAEYTFRAKFGTDGSDGRQLQHHDGLNTTMAATSPRWQRNSHGAAVVLCIMKRDTLFVLIVLIGFGTLIGRSQNAPKEPKESGAPNPPSSPTQSDASIDWPRARQLYQRHRRGEKLVSADAAYLQRALAEREKRQSGPGARRNGPGARQRQAPERLIPLTDLSATDRYEGEDGGLYGGGRNTPPEAHQKVVTAQMARVQPLDAAGQPSVDGTIGLVALSMSNATMEFSRFKLQADRSPLKSPQVTIVDCAQGGQAMAQWAPPEARPWHVARERLAVANVSLQQVQVAWIKLANVVPSGSLEEHGRWLERDTLAVLQNAHALFPNLQIAYLGSRTYGGYAVGALNPEPYAYEGAFAARWLIQRQIKGDPELAPAKAPLLLWGPYLWAEGTKGRKTDDLVWERGDFGQDGVHPSATGRQKVAALLLNFFTTDPNARTWFLKSNL